MFETHLRELAAAGWKVERAPHRHLMPQVVSARYPLLPEPAVGFLFGLDELANPDASAWFLCGADYAGTSGSAFSWNEPELRSLDAAASDPEWQDEVRSFWDVHFPFFLSVRTGCSYFALKLDGPRTGCVVAGCAPEFEEPVVEAASFAHFLERLVLAVRGSAESSVVRAAI